MRNESATTEKIQQTLTVLMRGGRLFHAVLAEGPGREQLARRLAQAALCEGEPKPCGQCSHCHKAEKGVHPDILVYGGSGSFPVEQVREIRTQAFVMPNEARGKVFILEEAQNMTIQAQNALLKILEEPPSGVVFVLTCDNKARLLTTILSRVTVLSLEEDISSQEGLEQAASFLREACIGSEYTALAQLVPYERDREGFGSFCGGLRRAAESLLLGRLQDQPELARRLTRLQSARIVAIIEEMEYTAARGGNMLLLTTALPGRIRQVLERGAS
ncbi:ATP-binding protein [Oscillospiraceae bacterium MB08-C2-2]|nr:ATP-binding protein [Oscillospiraceae bacterium MB08-C2-2]